MKVNVTINLNIEAPDSTGFSMDVMNLMDQILREMLDINSPKRDELHTIFDEDKPADMAGYFVVDDYPDSTGSYKVSLRSTQFESEILVPVTQPTFSVGTKVCCIHYVTGKPYFTGIVKDSHYNFSIGDNGKGEGVKSHSIYADYLYTVEGADGTLQTARQHELRLALEA